VPKKKSPGARKSPKLQNAELDSPDKEPGSPKMTPKKKLKMNQGKKKSKTKPLKKAKIIISAASGLNPLNF
jgi:electron transfer flavoprotein alpha subunit